MPGKKVPAHLFFFVVSERSSRLTPVQVVDYQGGRSASDIVAHGQQLLEVHGGPPIQIEELVSNEVFEEKCVQRSGICIISFLPHLLDENAAQRSKYLATLSAIAAAKDIKKLPVKFLWAVSYMCDNWCATHSSP